MDVWRNMIIGNSEAPIMSNTNEYNLHNNKTL